MKILDRFRKLIPTAGFKVTLILLNVLLIIVSVIFLSSHFDFNQERIQSIFNLLNALLLTVAATIGYRSFTLSKEKRKDERSEKVKKLTYELINNIDRPIYKFKTKINSKVKFSINNFIFRLHDVKSRNLDYITEHSTNQKLVVNLKTNEEKIFLTAEDYDDEAIKLFLDAEKKISHELFHFLNALYNVQAKAHSLLNYIVKEEMITHEDKEELILYVLNRFFKELILFFVRNHKDANNLVFFNYADHNEKIICYDVYHEIKKQLLSFEDIKKILGKYQYLLVTFCEAYLGLWEAEYNNVINDKRK